MTTDLPTTGRTTGTGTLAFLATLRPFVLFSTTACSFGWLNAHPPE